jgi:hypothetical protein
MNEIDDCCSNHCCVPVTVSYIATRDPAVNRDINKE